MQTKYEKAILEILQDYQAHKLTETEAVASVKALNVLDLGFATLDQSRSLRQGFPEVVYCAGKTIEQVVLIMEKLLEQHDNVLGTRATAAMYAAVKAKVPDAVYDEMARMIMVERQPLPQDADRVIAVVTAGTSDIPVAEEAALTAAIMGNKVQRIYDVGVAGLNRLLARVEDLRKANVIIVIAGMEGALASVVGGLVAKPVLAVPTSVGYGANFQGMSALLGMLNSCSGVAVVNIDNGFGAGRIASIINHLR
ncbi:MAG: nickel pincer cofactor biosynthesis protein LarB [Acidaminococcaceae bacterium]|nr:nickel pincer cofactor biosynthesis protein LarB [Acidaminococcaceae bacterium]